MAVTSPTETIAFGPVQVTCEADVLAPRPWTLAQAQWAAALLRGAPAGRVLELGSGAGHIGLAIARWSARQIVQVDASARACELARRNADAIGIDTEIRNADLSSALVPGERFIMITADPPYIPTTQVDDFPEDPRASIDGGVDGLDVARQCVGIAERHLEPDGMFLVQLWNATQARELAAEMRQTSTLHVEATWVVGEDGVLLLGRTPQAAPR